MNVVCVVGRLVHDAEPVVDADRYQVRLAVRRRLPGGRHEPGVVYLDITVGPLEPDQLADLRAGALVAVFGLIEVDEHWSDGVLWRRQEVIAEALEVLAPPL
jgi:hypothetical protein